MKKLLGIVVLGLLWCNVGFAEIYACSVDLTRYGRPGEIETKMYVRKGNFFYNNRNWKFDIYKEDKKEIYLIEKITDSLFIVIINKETKELTESFLSIEDSRENNEGRPNSYGKCVVK